MMVKAFDMVSAVKQKVEELTSYVKNQQSNSEMINVKIEII